MADEVCIVNVVGRLDSVTTPAFEKDLAARIGEGATRVVCNLAGCDYVSSTALRVILNTARNLKRQGGGFALCCARQYVMEVLEVAGFTAIIAVYETEAGAVASLQA